MNSSMNCEPLQTITAFPPFSKTMLTPLDLSLRSSLAPITPPSTPSPPRKKCRTTDDYNHWQPNVFGYFDNSSTLFNWNCGDTHSTERRNDQTDNSTNNTFSHPDDSTIVITEDEEDTNDDEFVDIINSDDEDPVLSQTSTNKTEDAASSSELSDQKFALTRNKLVYDDSEMHSRAVEGFAKLFEKGLSSDKLDNTSTQESNRPPSSNSSSLLKQIIKNKCDKRRLKIRKQAIDEDNSSPVSGTIIRKLRDDEELVVRKGDIDPAFNLVEITDEAKAILESIENKIGSYICQLCRTLYDDAFQLAQHRCARIVHIEYRCSECDKVFYCPANLASHRRWHKPKVDIPTCSSKKSSDEVSFKLLPENQSEDLSSENSFSCRECGKGFRRQAYLKKHMTSHQMLQDLRNAETLKLPCSNLSSTGLNYQFHQTPSIYSGQHQHLNPHYRVYPHTTRLPSFFPQFDHRHIGAFSDFYFPPHHHHHPDTLPSLQYAQNPSVRGFPVAGLNSLSSPLPSIPTSVK